MKLPASLIPTEHQVQSSMVVWARLQPWMKVFAIPNGAKLPFKKNAKGKRIAPQAAKLKKEGMTPGVSDLLVMYPNGRVVFVEVKRPKGGVQSDEQKEFQQVCQLFGFPYEIVRTLDEFIAVTTFYRTHQKAA